MDAAASDGSFGLTILVILALSYFLPVVVAALRKSANLGMIFVLTLLLGWTVLGWFVCLIWAAIGQTRAQRAFYEGAARQQVRT